MTHPPPPVPPEQAAGILSEAQLAKMRERAAGPYLKEHWCTMAMDRSDLLAHADALARRVEAAEQRAAAYAIILDDAFFVTLNANDFFAWATADAVRVDWCEHGELVLEAVQRWGRAGLDAWLCHSEKTEPQKPVVDRMSDATKLAFAEARTWLASRAAGEGIANPKETQP